jgi:excisionase family DNA binding protein
MAQEVDHVNAREAAEILGVAERSVRRWISTGRLPAVKEGRSFVIKLDEARSVHGQAAGVAVTRTRDELMQLRGRYAEIRERLRAVEADLAEERRRVGRLEAQLGLRAA